MKVQSSDFFKILLVEDDALISLNLINRLKRLGFPNVVHYESGEEAICAYREDDPDVVIMDIALSGELDGIDTVQRLKQMADVPVIFLTDLANKEIMRRLTKVDYINYLTKPFVDLDVVENIEKAMAMVNAKSIATSKSPIIKDALFVYTMEGRWEKILFREIRFIKAGRAYSELHLSNGKRVDISKSMGKVFGIMEQGGKTEAFKRVNQSIIINTAYIAAFFGNQVELGKERFQISKNYWPDHEQWILKV